MSYECKKTLFAITRVDAVKCLKVDCFMLFPNFLTWKMLLLTTLEDYTVLAKLTYCSPAWSGYCTAADLGRLDGFLHRCRWLGYCKQSQSSIAELFSDIDDTFFSRIISNSKHILQQFLHDRTSTYSLRSRNRSKVLVNKTSHLNNSIFLIRLLYKYSY